MQNRTKVIIAAVSLILAYTAGRYSAPTKIVTEIKTVEVEKKITDEEKKKHEKITVIEIENPDGTKTKKTIITKDEERKRHEDTEKDKRTEEKKLVERSSSKLHLSALTGVSIPPTASTPLIYGAHISKEILGPISVGVWGMTNRTAGFSIGLSL